MNTLMVNDLAVADAHAAGIVLSQAVAMHRLVSASARQR
jgi:hypothetical protein